MSEVSTTFGIDLGTTYSCVSYMKDGRATLCASKEGEYTTPSVVQMEPSEPAPVVGKTAKETSLFYPEYTIQFVKSKIGIVESFEIGDEDNKRTVTPIEISAEILKKLAADAAADSNMSVKDVVITVPAYFGNNERDATIQAGKLAGLNVIGLVEEPTAAAFYYLCEKNDADATVCVYDLGGGTFDITAIQKKGNEIKVITSEGDHDLGGKNWDDALITLVEEKFREATNMSEDEALDDEEFMQKLQLGCEQAKKQLSSATTASIPLSFDKKHKANIIITREEFEQVTSTHLEKSLVLTRQVFSYLEEKGIKVDKLLLVGGSSRMPQVEEALKKEFGGIVSEILVNEPEFSVAKGASIYCAWTMHNQIEVGKEFDTGVVSESGESVKEKVIDTHIDEESGSKIFQIEGSDGSKREVVVPQLPGAIQDIEIKTVATKSFGIRVLINGENKISNLILKDTVLPAVFEQSFGTNYNDQRDLSIALYQSDLRDAVYEPDYGTVIGNSALTGLPEGLPANSPVNIKIELSTDGVIVITGSYNGAPLIGELNTKYADGVADQ